MHFFCQKFALSLNEGFNRPTNIISKSNFYIKLWMEQDMNMELLYKQCNFYL